MLLVVCSVWDTNRSIEFRNSACPSFLVVPLFLFLGSLIGCLRGFPSVDSLQPTLRWEAFPWRQDPNNDQDSVLRRVTDVTYDLKIWTWRADTPNLEPVYDRRGLTVPFHKVNVRLMPSTVYWWSVRARFQLDGHSTVTEWGLLFYRSDKDITCCRPFYPLFPGEERPFRTPQQ